jgi:hemolysin III
MSHDHNSETERFSLLFFVIIITLTLASLFFVLYVFFPNIWRGEINASALSICIMVLGTHLSGAFVEFFFHRYVLHAPVIPFLSYFYRQHTHHHSLTRVTIKRGEGTVENYYPILEEKQHEASFFLWYSLLVFSGIATPVFVAVKWFFPELPVFISGYCGIALSMCLYEVLHAIEHKTLDWWQPKIDHARVGKVWRVLYGFHLMHHASIKSNESISGFSGFPLPDFLFGTYGKPDTLYEHGKLGVAKDFVAPRPLFFIRWLDHLAERTVERYRARKARV